MTVPILRQGRYLIVTLQPAVSDDDLSELWNGLARQIGASRARGAIIDVSEVDVLDSFAARTLRSIACTTRLRGASTVVVGIPPAVAFAMVRLGLTLEGVATALDLERAVALLEGELAP
ncbi:MAG: STAS domain-containing protein [Actinomycetota bacterium]